MSIPELPVPKLKRDRVKSFTEDVGISLNVVGLGGAVLGLVGWLGKVDPRILIPEAIGSAAFLIVGSIISHIGNYRERGRQIANLHQHGKDQFKFSNDYHDVQMAHAARREAALKEINLNITNELGTARAKHLAFREAHIIANGQQHPVVH